MTSDGQWTTFPTGTPVGTIPAGAAAVVTTVTVRWNNVTGNRVRLIGLPFCPDLLSFDDLGEADNFRGKLVRAFFKLLKWATSI